MRQVLFLSAVLSAACLVARAEPVSDAGYPAAARAAGVEGSATLTCARNAHMALRDCVVASESPAGQGFGAAALAMAARSPDNPALNVQDARLLGPQSLTVSFKLHPTASVDPDLSEMAHVITNPSIVHAPTPKEIWAAYPQGAYHVLLNGQATLQCDASASGRLTGCTVTEEAPRWEHFGEAALRVADAYRVTPMMRDGQPIEGAKVTVPVKFVAVAAAWASFTEASEDPFRGASADDTFHPAPSQWLRAPNADDVAVAYPAEAQRANVWGRAVLRCTVGSDGALQGCKVTGETPDKWGFGAAALTLAPRFQLSVTGPAGAPAAVGRQIIAPIAFLVPTRCSNCPTPYWK